MSQPPEREDLRQFAASLPPRGALLGLDLGTATIGLAVSDRDRLIATPRETIARRKWSHDREAIAALITGEEIAGLVLGYPRNMDGTLGARAQATRAFARNLASFGRPILLWDERLSTAAVTRMMEDEADLSRARRAQLVDKLAAAYILQGALDALRQHP